jgi:hypothetical protein
MSPSRVGSSRGNWPAEYLQALHVGGNRSEQLVISVIGNRLFHYADAPMLDTVTLLIESGFCNKPLLLILGANHSSIAKPIIPSEYQFAGSANPDDNRLEAEIILSNKKSALTPT